MKTLRFTSILLVLSGLLALGSIAATQSLAVTPVLKPLHFTSLASWYGGPCDKASVGPTASGIPNSVPGIALNFHKYSRAYLGKFFTVRAPNGRTLKIRETDISGGAGGRDLDINYAAAAAFGYKLSAKKCVLNFPANSKFTVVYTNGK